MKRKSVNDLAAFGGSPAFAAPLHVGLPNLPDPARLRARVDAIFERRVFTNQGPLVVELEERIGALLRVQHALAVCNGTIALQIAAQVLGLTGEVIVPSFTFIATAHALQWIGVTPVFCDVDPVTHCLDPREVERHLTARTSAILGVHLWGHPCDTERLAAIASAHGLKLFYDAAHAFGCSRGETMIGNFGHAEVFSLHATKCIHAFEGGLITTNDAGLATAIRTTRNFGFTGYDQVDRLGINGKMPEVSAAMALTLLEQMDEIVERNRQTRALYAEHLAGLRGVELYDPRAEGARNFHYLVLEVDSERAGLGRDELVRILHAENVLARRYFHPGCHRMEPYRTQRPDAGRGLPVTEALSTRTLVLPAGGAVGPDDVATVCELLRFSLDHAAPVRSRLGRGGQRGGGRNTIPG